MVGITQYKQVSNISTSDFTAVSSQELPHDVLGAIFCELSITHTNGGSSPSLNTNNMMGVISDISIIVNGSSRRVSLAGYILPHLSYAATGISVESSLIDTTSTQVTSTINFVLPFANMGALNNSQSSIRPQDSVLDLRNIAGVESASIQISWGNISITNVSSFDSATLKMTALVNTGIDGPITFGIRELRYSTVVLSSTGMVQTNMAVGGGSLNQYKSLLLIGRNSSDVLTDSLYSDVNLSSLGFDYWRSDTGPLATVNNYSGLAHVTGLYILPLYVYGRLTGRLVASELSQLQLQLTSLVSSSQVVTIVQDIINFRK
jgi:hypothetical protein